MNILHYVVVVQTEDVNITIEVSRKSKKAFVAANLLLEEAQNREGINSVRRVIDFSFQYVEGLIRLNSDNGQEAISHSGHSGCRD